MKEVYFCVPTALLKCFLCRSLICDTDIVLLFTALTCLLGELSVTLQCARNAHLHST